MSKKELVKLVSYMVMGDGGIYYISRSTNGKFVMNMKSENEDYVQYCANVLSNVTSVRVCERNVCNKDGHLRKPQLRLESSNHPFFNAIHDRVYTGKYKGIDPHSLKMLDAEALAILYMCDGSLYTDFAAGSKKRLVNDSYGVTLNMKRLCYGDQFILKKALKERLNLEWNINRHGKYFYLRLRCKDVPRFMEMVSPFVLPSFQYKLVRPAPEMGDDIVCSVEESTEACRNDKPAIAA